MRLEDELYAEMENGYRRAGTEFGYWAKYFIRDLRVKGALKTAKNMLRPQKKTEKIHRGLQRLLDAGRTDISLERLVLQERFRSLFTPAELAEAQRRLDSFPPDLVRRPVPPNENHPETLPETRTYHEGAVRSVLINVYERDPKAREACIAKHKARCAVCGLDFEERYGEIGRHFIHVHHTVPLSLRRGDYVLEPEKDLVPVCPNCHAMLHTSDPPLSVPELKEMLR
jgi:5-methylcytosine-specific restriction protein A